MPGGDDAQLRNRLLEGLTALTLPEDAPPPAVLAEPLLAFLKLLVKWNKAYNLTAVRDPAQMVGQHLLDSLAVARLVKPARVLDAGTGAGLPGIPLALALPGCHFTLLDSNAKKTRFVTQVVAELKLFNVTVVQSRVEEFAPAQRFSTVVSRAFASIDEMLRRTGHLCDKHGVILAMKGRFPDAELQTLPAGFRVEAVYPLTVPGLQAERHVVILQSD